MKIYACLLLLCFSVSAFGANTATISVVGLLLTWAGVASIFWGSVADGIAKRLYVWIGSTGRAAGSGEAANFSLSDAGLGFSVSF